MKEAKRCMRHIRSYKRQDTLLNMLLPGTNGTKQLCRDGKIQNAFSCLNKLYSSCAGSRQGMKHLEMMVDVGKWRNAIDNICNNMPYLENFAECEAKARSEFEPCAQDAKTLFGQQINFLKADLASLPMDQQREASKAQVDIACTFTTQILDCLQDPFERHCPKKMAVILRNTFQDFIPPACAKRAMQRSVDTPRYKTIGQEPEVRGFQNGRDGGYPDVVDIVRQGDGNSDNNNNNHGYDVEVKDDDNDDVNNKKVASFDEEYDVTDNSDKDPANGVVMVGNVAEVRGSSGGGGSGGGGGNGGKGDNGAASVIIGSGCFLVSVVVALLMV